MHEATRKIEALGSAKASIGCPMRFDEIIIPHLFNIVYVFSDYDEGANGSPDFLVDDDPLLSSSGCLLLPTALLK